MRGQVVSTFVSSKVNKILVCPPHNLPPPNNPLRPIRGWERKLGFKYDTVRARLNRGWSVYKSLTTPVNG